LNSDGSGANLTGLPNGSQLDHSGTKKIEAVSTGAQIQNRLEVITPNDSSTHLVQRLGSTDGSYGYVDLELVSPNSTAAGLPRLDLQVGNSTVASFLRGGGITFNGDTAAANALNDYEEGTWTPIFDGDGSNPTVNYAAQFGIYTKVGRLVHVSWNFTTNSVSGGSGNLRIAGLPFAASSNQSSATGACRTQNWNSNANSPIVGYIDNNESFVVLNRYDSAYASHTTVKVADLRTSGDSNQFKTSITYFTDA
jgi:hypothetical protein